MHQNTKEILENIDNKLKESNKIIKKIINDLEDVAKRNYIIVEDNKVSSAMYQPEREATLYVNFHTANLLLNYIKSKDKEINRLNNIINELEKYLIKHKEVDWDAQDTIIHEALAISFVYDILQDLKEGKK